MIHAAVEQFRRGASPPDEHAAAVLERLVAEEWRQHVLPAFALVPVEDWPALLRTCVEAERVARTHAAVVDRLRRRVRSAEKAAKALLTIKKFLRPEDDSAAAAALGMLKIEIKIERRIAQRGLLERRKSDAAAARSAGIGVLAEAIRVATGKTHRAEVAALADAVFDTREPVTKDMVRHALTPSQRRARWVHSPNMRWTTVAARSGPKIMPERAE
jgi:hypothetical protein